MDHSDPTKLTSFKALTPAHNSGGFSFSRLFDSFNQRKTSQAPKLPSTEEQDTGRSEYRECKISQYNACQINDKKENAEREDFNSWLTKSISSQSKLFGGKEKAPEKKVVVVVPRKEKWRYRNVRTILRRLSSLTIDKRWHQTTGDFKDDFKQYWMPDEHCKECYECGGKFNTFRRRHHCRVCGQIFCYKCCNQEVHGKVIGFSGDIRVCNYCFKIVHAYLNDTFDKSIEALSEDIKACEPGYPYEFTGSSSSTNSKSGKYLEEPTSYRIKRSPSSNSVVSSVAAERSPTPTVQRSPFDMFGVTPSEANSIKQNYLRDLWRKIADPKNGIELQTHRYRLKIYQNCLVGNELIEWLITQQKANTRVQAVGVGQDLLDFGWIECVNPDLMFMDEYMLYQPTKIALLETEAVLIAGPLASSDESDVDSIEQSFRDASVREDVEDDDPNWIKQMATGKNVGEDDQLAGSSSASQFRKFSTGRRLDLDLVTVGSTDTKKADLSLQMNLDSQTAYENKEIYDQMNKVSFITHVPPLPLDTYVCVDGYQSNVKKKVPKPNNNASMSEDILRGVVFPRNNMEPEVHVEDHHEENGRMEGGERLAMERLSAASHYHINALLEQLLKQGNLSESWKEVVLPFVWKVSDKVIPDVRRDDDMDIRRYVWINKVPGGLKAESHFISGVVFRKNVAHKRMNVTFSQPSILMMSCAIEYQRVENKMSSLDPLVLQEYAFLQNFVKRVLALKPNVILVEKNVARFAQDMLLAGGVTLVHNIKQTVMENIARCTGADILQTMEQVTRPRLGKCQEFRLQKFALPNGKITALMYIDGCAPDLGCSLILRGGIEKTLIKVKKILEYLIYVAYQLKLEAKFLSDEFALPPPLEYLTPSSSTADQSVTSNAELKSPEKPEDEEDGLAISSMCGGKDSSIEELENTVAGLATTEELSESFKFQEVLKMIILSSSPFCNYPMPYLLTEEGEQSTNRHFRPKQIYWSRYVDESSVSHPLKLVEDDHEWMTNEDRVNNEIIMKDAHPFTDPSVLMDYITKEGHMGTIMNDFRARGGRIDLKFFQKYEDREKRSVFGHYLKESVEDFDEVDGNKSKVVVDEFPKPENQTLLNPDTKMDCFDAFNHQKIAVLFSSYSSESKNAPKPCISPWAVYMEFYGRNDITLGGFLERYCFRSSYICPAANCDIPMVNHVRYFAHGSASLYIHMRNLESPIPGYDRTILTWSWCRICKQVTPVVPLSFESWAMSFAKYLELRFYGNKYTRRASVEPCGHSLHHDHYQYFSFANMVASFKYRAIDLHEVIIPSSKVVIGKQRNPKFLFSDVNDLCRKVDSVINEIRDRVNEAMKSDENTGISAQRESILKEFLTDLEKEHSNTQNVIQVIKLKTDSLSKADSLSRALESSRSTSTASVATRASKQDQVFLSVNGSGDSEDGKPRDSNSSNVIKNPDYIDCVALHAEENPMTDEDVHLLWVDITNKVFYLKKNICESVEHWNFKLQEFVTQDRKREKTAAPHTRAPASEHSEFYPDQMSTEMDPPQPKTVTHLHPEPVSEVFLTNGTILRQTHYGTKPRESSPFMDSLGSDSPAKVRKNSTPSIPNLSIDNPERTKIEETIKENDDTIGGVNGLRGPYIYTESIALTDDNKNEEFPVSNKEQSNEVSSWIKVNKFESLGGDSAGDIRDGCESDNESMTVEFNDDTGELTDIQSIVGDDESECPSEIEMAEEEDDDVVDIRLGQSAIDFEDNQNDEENIQQGPSSQLQGTSKNSKSVGAGVPAFSEFPKISEERLERVEYLTPNEVKAMQVARRRRNEWESRIRTVNDKKQQEKDHLKSLQRGRPLPFAENHFDTTGPALPIVGGEKEKKPEKKTSKITTATSATTKPKMTITTKADRKTQPGKIKGKTDTKQRIDPIQKLDPKKKSEPTTKQKDLIPKKRPAIKIKETTDTAISKGKQVKNPLLRRLVQNTHESSGEDSSDNAKQKAKKIPVKKVDKKNPIPTTNFAPVQMETTERAENLKQKEVAPENIKRNEVPPPENPFVDFRTTPTKPTPIPKITKSEMKNQTLNPACHRQKRIGHRRMKSAPFRIAISHEEESAPSELTPESPFIVVSPVLTKDEGLRSRSQSVGNRTSKYARGQKELSRLAERVVHEDRIDAERDVPEVLQIDGNTMKSASAGEIIGRLDGSPGFLLDGKLSVKRHLSSESERQTSDAAGQGSGKKLTKSGHSRHTSLSTRSASQDYDATDGKMAEGGPSKRGGSEKMKKIISQVFSSVVYQPIQRPFPPSEQYLPQVGGTSSIVINEREPTSLIAFTLSSRDYATQLQNIQDLLAGKKIQASNLTPSSLISQPNSPNVTRKQILNVSMPTESQQRPTTASPSSCNNAIGSSAGLMMRPIAPEQIARPKSWAGTTDVIIEASGFMNKTDSPPTRSESPALKRVYGKRHPLSSTEFEPSTEVLIDVDESSDDVMDGSSVRSDDPKKKEEEKTTVDHHVKLQFQNEVAKFYCSVYYAEQFRQLRETIFPEGEERFIQSLARCKFWKATGGKSGSSFSKSYDDRFVMKQMSRLEVQSFVDFGPRYFSYINKAIKENRPTALAKLLGVYRIGFKNSVTNATMRQDVLVMENLFHEKKVNKIFDLKGSLRGRKVHMSAKEDVLMDENLLEMICDTPLFIRAHSKAVLSKAIHNDTEFLSTNMVMDYSLLVGIDEAKQKLVVGIIDYIRTYTWDKKLESYVKSTGILGGAGKMPTVVSPDLYRKRFTEAMQRYFLMVPDKWTGFGNDLS